MHVLRVKGTRGAIWALAFTPDGRRLASVWPNGQLYLWDMDHYTAHPLAYPTYPGSIAIAPDGP